MIRAVLLTLAILICGQTIFVHPIDVTLSMRRKSLQQNRYWQMRQRLMKNEKQQFLGGKLALNFIENRANYVLMRAKSREIYNAGNSLIIRGRKRPDVVVLASDPVTMDFTRFISEFPGFINGNSFLPSYNFMEVIPKIEKSKVFKILRDMPKGGVLHAHETAIASLDYRLNNLTYRENLYVCDDNSTLQLKFFNTPDDNCNWQLLSEIRQDRAEAETINERLKQSFTMVTKNPKSVYTTVDEAWKKFSNIFKFMTPFTSYRPVYEDLYYRNLQEFYEDNVMYAEIRSTLSWLYDLDGKTYGPLEMVQILKDVTDRFVKEHPDFIGAKIIYAPRRAVDNERVDYYLKTMVQLKQLYPDFVAGFDLVGQEDKGKPLTEFANKLNAVDPKIQYFFHAGETKWNGMPTDLNLFDAFLLNTKRIGHGYALTKHPLLWKLVQRYDIAVEICPISNQVLGLVEDMRNHPAASLFASGSPVVISNDDPGHWGAQGLSYDFYEAFMGIMSANSDLRSLKQLAMNSLTYSSMSKREKQNALRKWQVKWDAFVAKLAQLA